MLRSLIVVLLMFASLPAAAERRVALIVGQSAYRHASALRNPTRDAAAVATTLRRVGFETVTARVDLDKASLVTALQQFAAQARGADVAMIYYSGHGLEMNGMNYLIPVDAELAADTDVAFEAVPLDLVLGSVAGARQLKVVVLDACRNNPFVNQMRRTFGTRSVGRGLARVEPDAGTLVAYAAREGATAADGSGDNSPFTTAFVNAVQTPGLEVRLMFGRIRDDVVEATDSGQEPAIYAALGGRPFYFVPPGGTASTPAIPAPATPPTPAALFRQALNGAWTGRSTYTDGQTGFPWAMMLSAEGGRLSGSTSEPNTFGDPSARFLTADIAGLVSGMTVEFVKTYDGTGGQHHSVRYVGTYDPVRRIVSGQWSLPGATGAFEMQPKD